MNSINSNPDPIEEIEEPINIIEVKKVSKLYGYSKSEAEKLLRKGAEKDEVFEETGVITALWDVNFNIKKGEIFVVIGLSGSGKSTIIRCLNLLNRPTSGKVLYEGNDISKLSRKELLNFRREKISMIFQNFALMSHRTVLANVAYGLEVKGMPKTEREAKAMEMIEMVGLSGMENQPVTSLSGGMRQRVGIARALANDPEVLLMDEPFSALDPLVRNDMQFELLSIQRKLEKTVVFITHDINEAFKLGDTVAIMRDGKVIQIDTPQNMSENPADEYVKKFIDSVDKSMIFNVGSVMIKPSCLVRINDKPEHAIKTMRQHGVSSAYVIDNKLRFCGILTLSGAIATHEQKLPISERLIGDLECVTEDMLVNDIMPMAAEAAFPIPVVDEANRLKGIVSRAAVLSSLV